LIWLKSGETVFHVLIENGSSEEKIGETKCELKKHKTRAHKSLKCQNCNDNFISENSLNEYRKKKFKSKTEKRITNARSRTIVRNHPVKFYNPGFQPGEVMIGSKLTFLSQKVVACTALCIQNRCNKTYWKDAWDSCPLPNLLQIFQFEMWARMAYLANSFWQIYMQHCRQKCQGQSGLIGRLKRIKKENQREVPTYRWLVYSLKKSQSGLQLLSNN
jgi:hypothetical protein